MLGATRQEAVAPVTRQALRSALMPTINSMSATGAAATARPYSLVRLAHDSALEGAVSSEPVSA